MGIDYRRPPLPAPTESMDETSGVETEVGTNVTNKTSYEIPEDGSPITISTHKVSGSKDKTRLGHHRQKSQTSLLIEYFEAAKVGDKAKSRPSVRVKVTPSTRKSSKGHDAIQVTSIGKDRKPSYTRRISLGSGRNAETGALAHTEGTEISHSSGSNLSGRPPVEIEVLNPNASDVSSRGLMYAPNESNISSMPPDSLLEDSRMTESELSRNLEHSEVSQDLEHSEDVTVTTENHLKAPVRSRSRSTSRDRIAQRVMEKLGATSSKPHKSVKSSRERSIGYDYDNDGYLKEKPHRSSKAHHGEDDSILSTRSYGSGTSQGSRMTNNPKLLAVVEDTIKRVILPEINAIKENQRQDRNLRSFESSRTSPPRDRYEGPELERRVSKSSSSPNMSSKPKVVLNRDGDDPGTTLSRGDSERKKTRKSSREYSDHASSRRSSGRHSRHSEGYDEEDRVRRKSSKSSHGLRDAAAGALAGGMLTAAALKHHESKDEVSQRRKKRSSKSRSSRSRSNSIADTTDEAYSRQEDIPPLPMASRINDSDVTRDSIISASTERPEARSEVMTPVREVSRGSVGEAFSPIASRTPTRSPLSHSKGLGMSHSNMSIDSPKSPNVGSFHKGRLAALGAAAFGGAAATKVHEDRRNGDSHVDADGYGEQSARRGIGSPAQSVSSLKQQFEEEPSLIPPGLRPRSAASRSSAAKLRETAASQASLRSSPTTQRLAQSRKQSQNIASEYVTPLERPQASFSREGTPGTPTNGESVDDWYERQHQLNNRYRDSFATSNNRDSYQTNPYPEDDKRFSAFTDGSFGASEPLDPEQNVKGLGANPAIYSTPAGIESNVASLMDPSTLSGSMQSHASPSKHNGTFADRMAEHRRESGGESPALYEGSTLSQTMPSQDRWAALSDHARTMSGARSRGDLDSAGSPRQSPVKSLNERHSVDEQPKLGASGLPVADDPLPEIGHFDDTKSEVSTNPSIIKGPLGGDATGKDSWPYTPEPPHSTQREVASPSVRSARSGQSSRGGQHKLLAAAAGGATALAAAHAAKQPRVEDEDEAQRGFTAGVEEPIDRAPTPTGSRDEGYATDFRNRSAGALTPQDDLQRYSREDIAEYSRAMDAQSPGEDDPFTSRATTKHTRQVSGNSHGMDSPLFDSSTGKGQDKIQSKDIVALMDHLTVRDAQRNARDTEILVTLVRSATEMRQYFDDMKQFIKEQDRIIMANTDRDAEQTVQKVLSGPRPQPSFGSPRTPRGPSQDEIQAKRKGVLRRALKGLTGGKKADDLARVEDMLMQILGNVEDLKHGGVPTRQPTSSYIYNAMDSYERLRAAPDSGYEPEDQEDNSSTPSQSARYPIQAKPEKQQYYSGYDGRRGSVNRVSTVMEGDEDLEDDDLTPEENDLLKHQFENNERMLTPTQETFRNRGAAPNETPYRGAETFSDSNGEALTPRAAEKQRKHKSNSSSVFGGVPKVSRWSKTTSSSAAPDLATLDSPKMARSNRPQSEASRSGSLDQYDNDGYRLRDDGRLRSTQSLAREQDRPVFQTGTRSMHSQSSKLTRTPSPLIPSEASSKLTRHSYEEREASPVQEDVDRDFDDPKYQAHRNSLLLQHPQPRQGPTGRHQNALETKAEDFDDPSGTNSDVSQRTVSDFDPATWGSSGTAALSRSRFSQADPMSPIGQGSGRGRDDAPLIPQQRKAVASQPQPEPNWEPQYSNSGYSKGGYNYSYSSPYGSGHLLEPIEEVRYSLETDSGHVSPGRI